jgi:hypothetical protein
MQQTTLASAALVAVLFLSDQSAAACVDRLPRFVPDGITYTAGSTRAGQPCQIGLGLLGGNVEDLRITMRPTHGILGLSAKEENRRYIAYAPSAGFVGYDRFEVYLQVVLRGHTLPTMTRIRVEMNVAP